MKPAQFLTPQAHSAAAGMSEATLNKPTNRRSAIIRCATLVAVAISLSFASDVFGAPPVVEGQYYRIKNVRSEKCLALEDGGNKVEGSQIVQRPSGPNERQQWKFVKEGRFYKIINRKSGLALNVQNASMEEGTPIIQWDASIKAENQQWSLEQHGAHYAIKARHSGLVLDVAGGTKEVKAPLIQYTFSESTNQLFELVPVNK